MLLYVVYLERHSPCREKAALGSGLGAEGFAGRHTGVTVQKSQTSLPSAQVLQECGQVRLGPVTAGSVQSLLALSSYHWLGPVIAGSLGSRKPASGAQCPASTRSFTDHA